MRIMGEETPARVGAISGIAFAVITLVAGALTGTPPGPDDSDRVWRDFFVDTHDRLLVQAWLMALAAALLVWFAAALRNVLQARGSNHTADVVLAGATVTSTLVIVAMAMQVALVHRAEDLSPALVRTIGLDFGAAVVVLLGISVGLIASAFIVAVRQVGGFPRWTIWLAALAIVLNVGASLGGVFLEDGALSMEGHVTVFLPTVSTLAWYVGVSISLLRGDRSHLRRPNQTAT